MMGDDIRSKGWTQGSIFDAAGSQKLKRHLSLREAHDTRFVLISHACDIVNESLDVVPEVEVCLASVVADEEGAKTFGKNPRELHFLMQSSSGVTPLALKSFEQYRIPRSLLAAYEPNPNEHLDETAVRILRTWLSRRYSRLTLPDAFNDRRRAVWGKVRKKSKSAGRRLKALYIAIDPRSPDVDPEFFRITLLGVMTDEDYDDQTLRTKVHQLIADISGLLGDCPGLEVDDWQLRPESRVTLQDLRYIVRLDDLDDLSVRHGDETTPD